MFNTANAKVLSKTGLTLVSDGYAWIEWTEWQLDYGKLKTCYKPSLESPVESVLGKQYFTFNYVLSVLPEFGEQLFLLSIKSDELWFLFVRQNRDYWDLRPP